MNARTSTGRGESAAVAGRAPADGRMARATMPRVRGRLVAVLFALAAAGLAGGASAAEDAATACPALLDHRFPALQDEKPQSLCQYAGKVILVVNTASYCGYTKQYDGLERLYDKYRDRGLVVLGFPSNDFNQEPGSNREIADFCRSTYGVRFPMFARSTVSGRTANPLYVRLAEMTGDRPQWNFHKYLIDRSGNGVTSFPSQLSPESPLLVGTIEKLLAVAQP
ncbi:glutathione peroxidase [Thauera sinica]|uniref:Glutathione peroxidase n=1 Tax=Thauera sinica TaxID=2665146 RepID=A0ABW1AV55_9RHOO|nr:glutathione peroxidase [Thauera sp. K11]